MDTYDDEIQLVAEKYGLPWLAVKAVVSVESSFRPDAMRYEKGYRWLVGKDLSLTEEDAQKTSWGLMQVMGAVARGYGFTGDLRQLLSPMVGLEYGCRHLAYYYQKYAIWCDAISSYNQGSPRKTDEGRYHNQEYVDKVMRKWNWFEIQIPLKETEV